MSHGGLRGGGGESWNIKNVSLRFLGFFFRSGMILIRLLRQYEEERDQSLAGEKKRELYQDLSVKTNIKF